MVGKMLGIGGWGAAEHAHRWVVGTILGWRIIFGNPNYNWRLDHAPSGDHLRLASHSVESRHILGNPK